MKALVIVTPSVQAANKYRNPHTDLSSKRLLRVSSCTRDQFLWLCDVTRRYGPTTIRRDSLGHEAELLLYLWRYVAQCAQILAFYLQ